MDIALLEQTTRQADRTAGARKAQGKDGTFFDTLKASQDAAQAAHDEAAPSRRQPREAARPRDDQAPERPAKPSADDTAAAAREPAGKTADGTVDAAVAEPPIAAPATAVSKTAGTAAPPQVETPVAMPEVEIVDTAESGLPQTAGEPTAPATPAPKTGQQTGAPLPRSEISPAPAGGQPIASALPVVNAPQASPTPDEGVVPTVSMPQALQTGIPGGVDGEAADLPVPSMQGAAAGQAPAGQNGAAMGQNQGQGQQGQGQGRQQLLSQTDGLTVAPGSEADAPVEADRLFNSLLGSKSTDLSAVGPAAAPVGTTSPLLSTSAMLTANRAATTPMPAVEQVVMRVQKAVAEGSDRISMSLKPAHLGRVDIQLDVGQDGRVQATVSVDRPETLTLLQRDARGLEQALQSAGLQADGDSLSFNLRQQARDGNGGSGQGDGDRPGRAGGGPMDDPQAQPPVSRRVALGGIDLKV